MHMWEKNKPPYTRIKPRTNSPPVPTDQAPQYVNYLPQHRCITAPRAQLMGRTHAAQLNNQHPSRAPHVIAPPTTAPNVLVLSTDVDAEQGEVLVSVGSFLLGNKHRAYVQQPNSEISCEFIPL